MSNKKTPTKDDSETKEAITDTERPKCGIIMPISAIDGLLPGHWEDVKGILRDAIALAGFEAELVSETEESTIIHTTIVHNLYNNPIVVCDVSGKNPNVMFELGIRLTFDKPTVVVKDDKTDYSFDMSPIEHLGYPRDLRFPQMVQFKEKLAAKVKATHDLAMKDRNYSTFLKHFGQFTVPKLEQKEVSPDQFIMKRLEELAQSMSRIERATRSTDGSRLAEAIGEVFEVHIGHLSGGRVKRIVNLIRAKYPELRIEMSPNTLRAYIPASLLPSEALYLRNRLMAELAGVTEQETRVSEDGISVAG